MIKYLLAMVFCIFFSTPASAMTVKELEVACVGLTDRMVTACKYYIFGVTEGAEVEAGEVGDKTRFCIPAGVKIDQLELMVRAGMERDLRSHPQDANLPASSFIGAVLNKAYPCR